MEPRGVGFEIGSVNSFTCEITGAPTIKETCCESWICDFMLWELPDDS